MDSSPSREELYQKTREELLKRQLSNNENFDRSILTLSSAALALSVTFMRGGSTHHYFYLLILAWVGFVSSIVVTICSCLFSQVGISRQLELAKEYYRENKEESLTAKNWCAELTDWSAYISASAFVTGIVLLLVYFSNNLPINTKGQSMATENSNPDTGNHVDNAASIQRPHKAVGGASVPRMQAVPTDDRGASIPPMQSAPPQSQSTSQSSEAGTGKSNK